MKQTTYLIAMLDAVERETSAERQRRAGTFSRSTPEKSALRRLSAAAHAWHSLCVTDPHGATLAMSSAAVDRLIASMRAGDGPDSVRLAREVESMLQNDPSWRPTLANVWTALVELLSRRGYPAGTRDEVSQALVEIRSVGDGFDLFELCRSLARCDRLATPCGDRVRHCFTELLEFVAPCTCGG